MSSSATGMSAQDSAGKILLAKREQTLVLIKPDAVQKGLISAILGYFERAGLRIIALKVLRPTREQLDKHFSTSKEWIKEMGLKCLASAKDYGLSIETQDAMVIGETIKEWNYQYLMEGRVVVAVLVGTHAISKVRKIIGHTFPSMSPPGTIRGDLGVDSPDVAFMENRSCRNLVHAPDNKDDALREIKCWFD